MNRLTPAVMACITKVLLQNWAPKLKNSVAKRKGAKNPEKFWSFDTFFKNIQPVQTEAIEEILEDEGEDISLLGAQTKFIARVNPNVIAQEGDKMTLFVNSEKFHYFETDTGKSI